MPIPVQLLDRIRSTSFDNHKIADTLEKIAVIADARNLNECAVNIEFDRATDAIHAGDLIPMVTLSLARRV